MRYLILASLLLIGCAKSSPDGSGSGVRVNLKDIPVKSSIGSQWVRSDNAVALDLSEAYINEPYSSNINREITIDWAASGWGKCSCASEFNGDNNRGAFSLRNCAFVPGSGINPGCSSADVDSGATFINTSYTIADGSLILCFGANNSSCATYF
jgi:hypothetical protein